MMKAVIAPLLLAGTLAFPGFQAAAQPADPLSRIFPGTSYRADVQEDVFAEGVRTYGGVTLRGQAADIGVDELSFRFLPDGALHLHAGAMTVQPHDPAVPAVSLTGLTLQLQDWPETAPGNGACAWANALSKARISGVLVKFPTEPLGITSMRFQGFAFEASGQPSGCWVEGLTALSSADIYRADGASASIDQLRAELSAPVSRAGAAGRSSASVRARASGVEVRTSSHTPAVGLSDVRITSAMAAGSLEGLLHVLQSSTLFGQDSKGQLNLMQLLNAATLLDGEINVHAPVTRIYSAGVVPTEAVTNFSRVGLSTVTGETGLKVALRRGQIAATAEASLTGLADMQAAVQATLAPYGRRKLQAAQSGRDLGAHLLPELFLENLHLMYADKGLEKYVLDLTGVPSGRYIQELGDLLAKQRPALVAKTLRDFAQGVSSFFRYAAEGREMAVISEPLSPLRLAEMSYLALTDMKKLTSRMNISVRPGKPIQ